MQNQPPALPGMVRCGAGEPLVLLHGVTCSSSVWHQVLPLLAPHHDTIALTALGHRGGMPVCSRPTRIADVVDDAERSIRALGLSRVHLAGNSMGGWLALELARRGLARSVCALSPAGLWEGSQRDHASRRLRSTVALATRTRALLPLLAPFAPFRRWALRDSAVAGERVSRAALLTLVGDLIGCGAARDLLRTDEACAPLRADCPITLAWAEHDRIFPVASSAPAARARLPEAHFELLRGVGHVPMLDDPALVASAILRATARAA